MAKGTGRRGGKRQAHLGRSPSGEETRRWLDTLPIGTRLPGTIVELRAYGAMVSVGSAIGLCHKSEWPTEAEGARYVLKVGSEFMFEVLHVEPDRGRVSLRLVGDSGVSPESATRGSGSPALTGAVVGDQARYGDGISRAVDEGVEAVNAVGKQFAKLGGPQRAGFVAEADHAATFNTDAAIGRSEASATRLASTAAKSPDLQVDPGNGGGPVLVSSKVYTTAKGSLDAQKGYGGQPRLVPSDQLDEVRRLAQEGAARARATGRPNRAAVAAELDEVGSRATDRIEAGGRQSKPRSYKEARSLGDRAAKGNVSAGELLPSPGRMIVDGARTGAKYGAAAGAVIKGGVAAADNLKAVYDGKKSVGAALGDVVVETGKGAAEGAAKGAVGGAATAGGQLLAQKVASDGLKGLLKGGAPAALAITSLEVATSAVRLATGAIDTDQFKEAAASSVKTGGLSYAGSAIGGAIGGPVGMLVGGVAGPMLADAAARSDLLGRLERALTSNTASGHSGADSFHLEARDAARRILEGDPNAVIFFDRLVPGRRGLIVGEAVVWSRGTLFALEFRAWRGELRFLPFTRKVEVEKSFLFWSWKEEREVETGEEYDGMILQTKESGGGNTYTKEHRNPLPRLRAFGGELAHWLGRGNSRWSRVVGHAAVVFCGGGTVLEGELARADGFCRLEDLSAYLDEHGDADRARRGPPQWMLDDLALTPTWDMVSDASGNVYQGLLSESSLEVQLADGTPLEVPYSSVWKVQVQSGGFLSQADKVIIQLRSGKLIAGAVPRSTVTLRRGRHVREFKLRDLVEVVPCSTFFTMEVPRE